MTTQFASNGSGGCIGHTVTGFSQEYRAWGESMVALAEKQAAFRARQREVLEQQAEALDQRYPLSFGGLD